MARPEYSGPWHRIRLRILERDGHLCQVRGPKCTKVATQVDHIVEVSKGGSWWDPANLRASCQPCNRHRVDSQGSSKWRTASTKITLVVGPPMAGKTHHVRRASAVGDLIVDYGDLAEAVGGSHEAVNAARSALVDMLRRGAVESSRAWILSADPDAEARYPWHDRVVIDPGEDVCLRRCTEGGRSELTRLVRAWYEKRVEASRGEGATPSRVW